MLSRQHENPRDAFGDLRGGTVFAGIPNENHCLPLSSGTSVAPPDGGITGSKVPPREGADLFAQQHERSALSTFHGPDSGTNDGDHQADVG